MKEVIKPGGLVTKPKGIYFLDLCRSIEVMPFIDPKGITYTVKSP